VQTRTEHDAYGSVSLGADVHYGIQTVRTVENMSFSGVTLAQFPEYIRAKLDELILARITLAEINCAFEAFHDTTAVNVGRTVVEFGGI